MIRVDVLEMNHNIYVIEYEYTEDVGLGTSANAWIRTFKNYINVRDVPERFYAYLLKTAGIRPPRDSIACFTDYAAAQEYALMVPILMASE